MRRLQLLYLYSITIFGTKRGKYLETSYQNLSLLLSSSFLHVVHKTCITTQCHIRRVCKVITRGNKKKGAPTHDLFRLESFFFIIIEKMEV
jgi:hypothetical protein